MFDKRYRKRRTQAVVSGAAAIGSVLLLILTCAPRIPRVTAAAGADNAAARRAALAAYGSLPLTFEVNEGQAAPPVKFLARGDGYGLYLTATEALLSLHKGGDRARAGDKAAPAEQTARLRLVPRGASPRAHVEGLDELASRSNYFIGNDPARWRTGVRHYARVRYADIYPGVALVYYGRQRQLEYDFVVAPGADYRQIRLGVEGATALTLDAHGDLLLKVAGGELRQPRPVIYQERADGGRAEIAGGYVLGETGREVRFWLGAHDARRPVIIDPVLVYSTYLGGTGTDQGFGIAIDAARNAYVTGLTDSGNFPTVNPYQANLNGTRSDVFVTKLNASGTAIVYSTYIGGTFGDIGHGIDVDNAGNAYVTGTTGGSISTNDFPTVNAYDDTYNGTDDAFLLKLNPAGNALLYSTYLGGSNTEVAFEVAVNRTTGEAYIGGQTLSLTGSAFPTTAGAFKTAGSPTDVGDGFVTKFSAAGNTLVYSTLIGGNDGSDPVNDLVIDATGATYVVGSTNSGFFPVTPGAFQTTCTNCNIGRFDAYVAKLNPAGTALDYATYLGGSQTDVGNGIDIDAAGNAYVTGEAESIASSTKPFPTTPGALKPTATSFDAYVTKLNPTGTALVYSTYLGGNNNSDQGYAIAVDRAGNADVTGTTRATDFPLVNPLSTVPPNGADGVFISTLNPQGTALIFSTYFGSGQGRSVVADSSGNIYVAGYTFGGLPTMNPIQATNQFTDAFVAKIAVANLPNAGDVRISEFRFHGATGATDEFIELYNATDSALTVNSLDGSAGWALVAAGGRVLVNLPNGTTIPRRGHLLAVNSAGYSLSGYPAGDSAGATGDFSYTEDIPDNSGVALFATQNANNFTLANRLDAAGYSNVIDPLYREGGGIAGFPEANGSDYSQVRRLSSGRPQDTDDNDADFLFIATQGDTIYAPNGNISILGAPGPENLSSPVEHNADVKTSLLDSCAGPGACQNRVRNPAPEPAQSACSPLGTLSLRRRFKNNTGQPVTRLRFRVVDITTLGNRTPSEADVRALSSTQTVVVLSTGTPATVEGTTLEQPPVQAQCGGLNSSLSAGTITLAQPLAPGASINVQFLLGVVQGGSFRFFVNVEALTGSSGVTSRPASKSALKWRY